MPLWLRLKPEMRSVVDSNMVLLLNQNILMQDKYRKSGHSSSGVLSILSKAIWYSLHTFVMATVKRTGFSDGSDSKKSASEAGDPGSIPGLGRSPEEGNGNLL